MEIKLKPHSFPCHDAIFDGKKTIVTAVIVPLKTIIQNEEKTKQILLYSWSCNYVESCENSQCVYSKKRLQKIQSQNK
jgi:hypothetical protein